MTKTLTEQWREGTLAGGDYYIKTTGLGIDKVIINYYEKELKQFDGLCDCSISEVLAPVPSYEEYKELLSKTEQLEKRLEIATKALEEYAEIETYDWVDSKVVALKALKEMEGLE